MKFLEKENIDFRKWDLTIANSRTENIFCYSWYLEATAKNWGGLISEDYNTILPVPYSSKLGVKQIYQPAFTRELDIIGTDFTWDDALSVLASQFKGIQFRNSSQSLLDQQEERTHQFLDLTSNYKLSTNAKRLIKKGKDQFTIEVTDNPHELINLFKATAFSKIDSISEGDLVTLSNLMKAAMATNHCEILQLHDNKKTIAAGCFLKDKKRITYLKGAATDEAKKNGAMYVLINHALEKYKSNFDVFDFGGSDIENVANFYKKFGATDRTYYNYTINNLPSWFKALKKIKK